MSIQKIHSKDPKEHAQNIEKYISELKHFCHDEVKSVSNPKAKALFEATADVLDGLEKALSDFQSENEEPWITDPNRPTPQ